jgi:hypothetical protein
VGSLKKLSWVFFRTHVDKVIRRKCSPLRCISALGGGCQSNWVCYARWRAPNMRKKSERIEANQRSVQLAGRAVCAPHPHHTQRQRKKAAPWSLQRKRDAQRKSTGEAFCRIQTDWREFNAVRALGVNDKSDIIKHSADWGHCIWAVKKWKWLVRGAESDRP